MYVAVLIGLAAFLIFSILAAITFGNADLSLKDVYSVIAYKLFHIKSLSAYAEGAVHDVVWLIRLPRVLLALAVGMALSVCGVVMQAIVDDAKAVIDKTLTATADVEEKPSVMVLEPLGEDITNYGAKSLGGDMVTQLGATLANPDASTAGKEDIIAANPDVIFVVYMPYAGDDPETVKESQLAVIKDDEALQSLDAVKNGRVYPIMLSEMYASATRTQDGIETFAKGLYPDVNLD